MRAGCWSGEQELEPNAVYGYRWLFGLIYPVIEKSPKGKSRRAIAIGPPMVQVLREHKARQDEEKAEAGLIYHDRDYVFCREDGEPYYPRYFTTCGRTPAWRRACR